MLKLKKALFLTIKMPKPQLHWLWWCFTHLKSCSYLKGIECYIRKLSNSDKESDIVKEALGRLSARLVIEVICCKKVITLFSENVIFRINETCHIIRNYLKLFETCRHKACWSLLSLMLFLSLGF